MIISCLCRDFQETRPFQKNFFMLGTGIAQVDRSLRIRVVLILSFLGLILSLTKQATVLIPLSLPIAVASK
jgi:hypothetical protein